MLLLVLPALLIALFFMGYKLQSISILFALMITLLVVLGISITTTSMGVIFFTAFLSAILTFMILASLDLLGYTSIINIGLVIFSGAGLNPTFCLIFMAVLGIGFRGLGKAIRSVSPSSDMSPDERALFLIKGFKRSDVLADIKTEAWLNLQVGGLMTITMTLLYSLGYQLEGFINFIIPLSGLFTACMWAYFISEKVDDKVNFILGAFLSVLPIILSFMAFDGGNPALPVMAAFLFLFGNKSSKKERIEIKDLDEIVPYSTPAGLRNDISGISYAVGLLSSIFIGVPRFVLGECLFGDSVHKKVQHWLSEAISEYFGNILLFIYGISRTGIADNINRLDVVMPTDTFFLMGVLILGIIIISYVYLESFLEAYSWITEGAISDNHLGDFLKVAFVLITGTNPFLVLALITMGYSINWVFSHFEIPISASMVGISALPAYFIFL